MQSAIELLELNGAVTNFDIDAIIETSLAVAKGHMSVEELTDLISLYVEPGLGNLYQSS